MKNTVDNLKKEAWDRVSRNHHHRATPFQISLRDLTLFHFTRSKKLSLITDLLIHSSFTSLLAMDSNSSPENILSSGGNMRICEKGILILLRKMSVGSKNLCFSSDLHTGLRICPQNCSFLLRCQEEAEWKWFWIILIQTNKQTKNAQGQLD